MSTHYPLCCWGFRLLQTILYCWQIILFQWCTFFSFSMFSNPVTCASHLGHALSRSQIFHVLPQEVANLIMRKLTSFQQLLLTQGIISIITIVKPSSTSQKNPYFFRKLPHSTFLLHVAIKKLFDNEWTKSIEAESLNQQCLTSDYCHCSQQERKL